MKTISAPCQGGRRRCRRLGVVVVDRQLGDRPRRLDAGHARHADVEEDDVGTVLLGQRDRLGAVLRLGDDLERGPDLGQAGAQLLAQQPLVVGDDGGRQSAVLMAPDAAQSGRAPPADGCGRRQSSQPISANGDSTSAQRGRRGEQAEGDAERADDDRRRRPRPARRRWR